MRTLLLILLMILGNTITTFAKAPTEESKKDPARSQAAAAPTDTSTKSSQSIVDDPQSRGGEADSVVQVANLIYAGTKTSECFADHFLKKAEQDSAITTSRQLHTAKLATSEIYNYPLVIMTGEGEFTLLAEERENLRTFIERGGFLLASAGCSSPEWDQSFRREMAIVFQDKQLQEIGMDNMIFHTAYDINTMTAKHGTPKPLVGLYFGHRLGVLYSQDGLNDTSNSKGCCCCGGNEIKNAEEINVNILIYSLLQ